MPQSVRFLFCIVTLVFLSACAPGTPDQLRREAALRTSITVERDIRSVYKSLRASVEECTGPAQADLFESEGTGWIKRSAPPFMHGEQVLLYYDLTALGPSSTKIEGYSAFGLGWTKKLEATERWAKGETGCP